MEQQAVKQELIAKLLNIYQEKPLSLPLLLLLYFQKFNHTDWGNLERVGFSFLLFIIAL